MAWAIQTFALTKCFPTPQGWLGLLSRKDSARPAVNRVDLAVKQGELFGLLGPNGAGKTTLIKLLSTLILPTSGSALVNGFDLENEAAIKTSIGLVTSDERSFFWRLTGRKNLEFFATLHGLSGDLQEERVDLALEQTGLQDAAGSRFQTYSSGMRQRLSIARALLTRPRLLFMDEPTKGLDPTATRQLYRLVREQLVGRQGMTILLTTHILDEAEQLCDRVAVMHRGKIRGCGSVSELRGALGLQDRYHLVVRAPKDGLEGALAAAHPGLESERLPESIPGQHGLAISFKANDEEEHLERVLDSIRMHEGRIRQLSRLSDSLDVIFEKLTEDETGSPGPQLAAPDAGSLTRRPPLAAPSSPRLAPGSLHNAPRIALAFIKRDYREEVSYRVSFFLQFFGIFFSVAVFYFIARMLGPAAGPYLTAYGGDYFSFVLIGIAFSGYFGVGLSGFASKLRHAQTTGTLEAMLSTPTGISTIILSSSLWSYLMTTFRVLVYLAIGVGFLGVNLGGGNYLAAVLVLILTIVAFSSMGIIAASFIMVLKRGDLVTWAFSSLSSLLGGVYYPIAVLPGWLQTLAKLLPITYSLDAMRQALLRGAGFMALLPQMLALAGFCAILLPLSLFSFQYAVRRARMDGSLTHY